MSLVVSVRMEKLLVRRKQRSDKENKCFYVCEILIRFDVDEREKILAAFSLLTVKLKKTMETVLSPKNEDN